MTNPEYEKKKSRDESGFSEKQLDIDIETGVFKKKKLKKHYSKRNPKNDKIGFWIGSSLVERSPEATSRCPYRCFTFIF